MRDFVPLSANHAIFRKAVAVTNAAEKQRVSEGGATHLGLWARAGLIGGTGFVGGNLLRNGPLRAIIRQRRLPTLVGNGSAR